jgi:hypothetical protein
MWFTTCEKRRREEMDAARVRTGSRHTTTNDASQRRTTRHNDERRATVARRARAGAVGHDPFFWLLRNDE